MRLDQRPLPHLACGKGVHTLKPWVKYPSQVFGLSHKKSNQYRWVWEQMCQADGWHRKWGWSQEDFETPCLAKPWHKQCFPKPSSPLITTKSHPDPGTGGRREHRWEDSTSRAAKGWHHQGAFSSWLPVVLSPHPSTPRPLWRFYSF